jgi:biopolymer transport protein ExbD|tara:strand:- start:421 stop:861 length:441 start_codon:yes stop_codon:yes gene_type:complete
VRRSRASRREATVELTPLIDVVFLLLIFFMVSTSFVQNEALNVDLPQANGDAQSSQDLYINVIVQEDGRYEIDGNLVADESLAGLVNTLRSIVEKNAAQNNSLPVIISADALATHQSVVRIMDACAQAGLSQISLATQPILNPSKE